MNRTQTPTLPRPYESPSAEILALKHEGAFCASTGTLQDLGTNPLHEDEFDDEN